MPNLEMATFLNDACETRKGKSARHQRCEKTANFVYLGDAPFGTKGFKIDCERIKALLSPRPDGRYLRISLVKDRVRRTGEAEAETHRFRTGDDGAVPRTGRGIVFNRACVLPLESNKTPDLTRIWNNAHALCALGWA